MSNIDQIRYLSFEEEIRETKKFYQDISKIRVALSSKRRKPFITGYFKTLEQCLNFTLAKNWIAGEEVVFGDWYPEYLLLGHFFEGFLRTILMRELSIEKFFAMCFNEGKKEFKTLHTLIEKIIELQNIKDLTQEQQIRVKDVLNYVKLQRNQYAHYHPKDYDTYSVRIEIYSLLKKLVLLFNIPFSRKTLNNLDRIIDENRIQSGMGFKPVWNYE